MVEFNLLKPNDYYTQLKDLSDPWYTCQVTSGCSFLLANNVKVNTQGWRLPDVINDICEGSIGKTWAKKVGYNGSPREIHIILQYAINLLAGRKVDDFNTGFPFEELVFDLVHGRSSIVAGTFFSDGHVVHLGGLVTTQDNISQAVEPSQIDMKAIQYYIVNDPIGDWHTFRKDGSGKRYDLTTSGYGVKFTPSELNTLLSSANSDQKLAHRFIG